MKKKMCMFDLDGTLDLTDARLSAEILKLSKMGVSFVVSTGRSNSYVINTCVKNNILPPKYIIADNGGSVYDTIKKVYLRKVDLALSKRNRLIQKFLELGGRVEDIRYSDGDNLYAVNDELVKRFYFKDKTVTYYGREEIVGQLLRADVDVTKITLVAQRKLMDKLVKFMKEEELKCFPDGGNTKFPEKSRNNYRLDITDGETSKGDGVRFLAEHLGIDTFMCIGNGQNDFSMFKYAIDTDNQAVIVRNYENGEMLHESKELVEKAMTYAEQNGKKDNLIVATFPANGLIGQLEEKSYNKQRRNTFVDGLRINVRKSQSKVLGKKQNIPIKNQDRMR